MRRSDGLFAPSMSGNGFVVLLDAPRVQRSLEASDVARVRMRLRRSLKNHLAKRLTGRESDMFGCYVGGSLMRDEDGIPVERIVYRSLEEAFADALREREREEKRQLANLRRVLETGQVRSVYQPVVDLENRRVIGYEALTRVPRGRFASTEHLFKVAAETKTLWTLERMCRQKALEGLPAMDRDQLLFLNIEPDSIHDPELVASSFLNRLSSRGLGPEQVVLEMTEHSAVTDFAAVRRTLTEFRKMGFRLAMDDVGSGYSGLQAIAEIAPDFIKVDMTLVRSVHTHPIKRELISTIRRFTDTTGIVLIAEGVETYEELESLIGAGVRCAQGFLFARPASSPASLDWDRIPRCS
jgi:EAL domain-containing protein (putative c-di-GMP-specific phosphodiesterase class I)